jgi:hypothetical protein
MSLRSLAITFPSSNRVSEKRENRGLLLLMFGNMLNAIVRNPDNLSQAGKSCRIQLQVVLQSARGFTEGTVFL